MKLETRLIPDNGAPQGKGKGRERGQKHDHVCDCMLFKIGFLDISNPANSLLLWPIFT